MSALDPTRLDGSGFRLPPSSFQAELDKLGSGFLGIGPANSEGDGAKGKFGKRLSLEDRLRIARSTEKRLVLSRRYGISTSYVDDLRRKRDELEGRAA